MRHSYAGIGQGIPARYLDHGRNSCGRTGGAGSLFSGHRLPCFSEVVETHDDADKDMKNID